VSLGFLGWYLAGLMAVAGLSLAGWWRGWAWLAPPAGPLLVMVAGLGLLLAALVHLRARLAAWQAEVAHQVRLRAEALERRRQVERALMDHYDALVILLDREGRYLELNREARHLLEVEDSRQVVGKYLEEHLDPKSAPRFRQLLRQALAQGEARLEGRWLHFAGRERYLEVVARTIGNPWDQSLLLILRDLSDQKLRDHKLWETERLASLGLLAAGVAHQVNNPLGVLLGFCELLLDRTPPGAEGRRELEIIHQQGQECKRIVDGLLSYSRLSDLGGSGGDLVAALRAVLEMVSGVLSERGIELEVRLPQELPPTPAPAGHAAGVPEPHRQRHGGHARWRPAHGGGGPAHQAPSPGHPARHAAGGPALHRDRHRGHRLRHPPRAPGTHLRPLFHHQGGGPGHRPGPVGGLWHRARGRRHHRLPEPAPRPRGGRGHPLHPAPAPGRGKGGIVTRLPSADPDVATDPSPNLEPPAEASILVVDDEPYMCELIERIIRENTPYHTRAVTQAQELPAALDTQLWDLVLLDLRMPGVEGLELLEYIRRHHPDTEVVMVTAYGTIPTAVEAMRLGAAGFLTKPFAKEQLLVTLRQVLGWLALKRENSALKRALARRYHLEGLIGSGPHMRRVVAQARKLAAEAVPVLIRGEFGTGRSFLARAMHHAGPRAAGPLLELACGPLSRGGPRRPAGPAGPARAVGPRPPRHPALDRGVEPAPGGAAGPGRIPGPGALHPGGGRAPDEQRRAPAGHL